VRKNSAQSKFQNFIDFFFGKKEKNREIKQIQKDFLFGRKKFHTIRKL